MLTLMADQFNRRFIMFEFQTRKVVDRLRQLPVPAASRQQQNQNQQVPVRAEIDFLSEKKAKLLDTFRQLQGLGGSR